MGRIRFERQAPAAASDPQRADVACFVGLVARRPGEVPKEVAGWLAERGWTARALRRPDESEEQAAARLQDLLDLPVPIDTWEAFDALFAWDRRPLDPLDPGRRIGATYLGAAVRSFFAQGGRKCYVVRTGDPFAYAAPLEARVEPLDRLVPRRGGNRLAVNPGDRRTWSGVGHLFGLPDVSFVCLPDLPDLVRELPPNPPVAIERTEPPERFVECSAPEPLPPEDGWARRLQAPRCRASGYSTWALAVRAVGRLLGERLREVHLIAAVPLPHDGDRETADLSQVLQGRVWPGDPKAAEPGFGSAFVQLAYPWLRTPGSLNLPEELESPDGALAGLLARNALARGTFRSAAGLDLAGVRAVGPELRRDQSEKAGAHKLALIDRVSLFGPTPSGLRLLSDVTTASDASYRPGGVSRLVSTLVRAARRLGEDSTFEPSGEALWTRVQDRMSTLLRALWDLGALRGATPAQAFDVACGRGTMSQQDIDQGRVIARVRFEAAAPVESITVVLALDEGGQVSLMGAEAA